MPKPATILVPLLAAVAAAASLVAWVEHRQMDAQSLIVRKAALLESENDALQQAVKSAEREASDARNVLRRSRIERDVASIRQLDFSKPVVYEMLDRQGIRQVVAGKLSEQYSDQEIKDMSTGYSALGLLPPDFPLKQAYINLLGEQIAAFYDQHQHKLFMFQDAGLDNAQNRVILAHELTHALQDQNFGLLKFALELKNNDDRAAAASALIEGDATLVMSEYMVKDMTWRTLADTVGFSVTQSMDEIRKAPHFLREMLVFPYIKGQQFCAAVYARGGYPALSAAYANPPTSTAQILHPKKYFAESREDPMPISFAGTTFKGEKPLADNVLGEMGCRILFSQDDADSAEKVAAGWRGDRYLVFDKGRTLVWRTIWRSSEAAEAAIELFRGVCEKQFKIMRGAREHPMSGESPIPHSSETLSTQEMEIWDSSEKGDGRYYSIVQVSPNEVVFILATDEKSADLLKQQFAGASHG